MPTPSARTVNRLLWTAQCLAALVFLFAGSMKFIGATTITAVYMGVVMAIFPAVVGIATAWIAYARTRVVPLVDESGRALGAT